MANQITEDSVQIRDVWHENLEQEFEMIREIVKDYNYVATDTEFPGEVVRLRRNFESREEANYQKLKENVNLTKLLQLGLTFSDEKGNLPTCGTGKYCVWQFNFREFDQENDAYASESLKFLKQTSRIDLNKFKEEGVDIGEFGELLVSSGIFTNNCSKDAHWIAFQGGYDFGYLIKLLTGRDLPETQEKFFMSMRTFFPKFYDIKCMIEYADGIYGGLEQVAATVGVQRIGVAHQAGSDSLLTCRVFMKLKEIWSPGSIESSAGKLYGLEG